MRIAPAPPPPLPQPPTAPSGPAAPSGDPFEALLAAARRPAQDSGAEMFNEHGYFRGRAAEASGPGGTAAAAGSGVPVRSPSQPQAPADPSAPAPGEVRPSAAAPVRTADARVVPAVARAPAGEASAAPVQPSASAEPAAPARLEPRSPAQPRAAAAPPQPRRQPGAAATGLALVLQAAGQEAQLSVRLPRLAREERGRLRAVIAELLALHGFAAAEVRLNGESEPPARL